MADGSSPRMGGFPDPVTEAVWTANRNISDAAAALLALLPHEASFELDGPGFSVLIERTRRGLDG